MLHELETLFVKDITLSVPDNLFQTHVPLLSFVIYDLFTVDTFF